MQLSHNKKKVFGVFILVSIIGVFGVFLSLRQPELDLTPGMSVDDIPLPFGGSSSELKGSISSIGVKAGIPVRYVSFDNNEIFEMLQGSTRTDRVDFVVTPDSSTISDGAYFASVLTSSNDMKYVGYEYSTRDATTENAMRDQQEANPATALTYSQLFPGTFFASDTSYDEFGSTAGITFKKPSEMKLKKNTRYFIKVITGTNVKFSARNVTWCGDMSTQNPNSLGQIEQCDDGNLVNTDGCTNVCTATNNPSPWYNSAKSFDVNNDGFVSPLDSLVIINYINAHGGSESPVGTSAAPPYLDVNNDWKVTVADTKMVQDAITIGYCGDTVTQAPNASGQTEQCDDGNSVDTDGCRNDCRFPSLPPL